MMMKIEYLQVVIPNPLQIADVLNKHGQEGWNFCDMVQVAAPSQVVGGHAQMALMVLLSRPVLSRTIAAERTVGKFPLREPKAIEPGRTTHCSVTGCFSLARFECDGLELCEDHYDPHPQAQ